MIPTGSTYCVEDPREVKIPSQATTHPTKRPGGNDDRPHEKVDMVCSERQRNDIAAARSVETRRAYTE